MAAFSKCNCFAYDVMRGLHQLHAAGHTLKACLINTAITATWTVLANATEIAAQNGYVAGGYDVQNDVTQATNVATLTGVDIVVTASGGSFGPWRAWLMYNSTASASPLMGGWDRGSSVTTEDGTTATLDFGASVYALTC